MQYRRRCVHCRHVFETEKRYAKSCGCKRGPFERICMVCGQTFESRSHQAKLCGPECRVERSRHLDNKRPDAIKLAPTARARFSEARVISDLDNRGHDVFLAITRPGVLAIEEEGAMRRILVRSASVLGDGKTAYAPVGDAEKNYTLALVRDGDITYQPDISNKEAE